MSGVQGMPGGQGMGGMVPGGGMAGGMGGSPAGGMAGQGEGHMYSKSFHIPNDMVGKLIGKGGDTLKRIQYMSGARIQVDHTHTQGEQRQVTVSGQSQTSVDRAHQMAMEIIAPEVPAGDTAEDEVDCPVDMVGRIIGRRGETVRALQQVTKTQIRINQEVPEGMPRKVIISGTPDRIHEAKEWLGRLIGDASNEPMQQLMQAAQASDGPARSERRRRPRHFRVGRYVIAAALCGASPAECWPRVRVCADHYLSPHSAGCCRLERQDPPRPQGHHRQDHRQAGLHHS